MKVALVTGSTSGIGLATAQKLYNRGHSIVLNSANPEHSIADTFDDVSRVLFVQADISDAQQLEAMKATIDERFGRLDIMVACAGILPLPCGIDNITDESIDKTIDVNLKGTFYSLRLFGKYIQESGGGGAICTVASVDGIIGEPYGAVYSATKAGIISLTKSFARKLNDPLVRVNAVAPGLIDTPLAASTGEDPSWTTDLSIIKRMGMPGEIANVINFLVSDDASFVTGQVLAVDGGFTLK